MFCICVGSPTVAPPMVGMAVLRLPKNGFGFENLPLCLGMLFHDIMPYVGNGSPPWFALSHKIYLCSD